MSGKNPIFNSRLASRSRAAAPRTFPPASRPSLDRAEPLHKPATSIKNLTHAPLEGDAAAVSSLRLPPWRASSGLLSSPCPWRWSTSPSSSSRCCWKGCTHMGTPRHPLLQHAVQGGGELRLPIDSLSRRVRRNGAELARGGQQREDVVLLRAFMTAGPVQEPIRQPALWAERARAGIWVRASRQQSQHALNGAPLGGVAERADVSEGASTSTWAHAGAVAHVLGAGQVRVGALREKLLHYRDDVHRLRLRP